MLEISREDVHGNIADHAKRDVEEVTSSYNPD
jgi:hypothetical protein